MNVARSDAERAHEHERRAERYEALADATATDWADDYRRWAAEDRAAAARLWAGIEEAGCPTS